MKLVTTIAGVAVDIDFATLPEASQAFVIEYGLKQYIQDGAAVSKTFTDKDRKGQAKTEAEIEAEKREGVEERLANLVSGEFSRRGPAAPKRTPEERHRDEIVQEALERIAKATGKTLPKKTGKTANPELLAKFHAAYYAKNAAAIDKEVARRVRAGAPVEDFDLDSIQ